MEKEKQKNEGSDGGTLLEDIIWKYIDKGRDIDREEEERGNEKR